MWGAKRLLGSRIVTITVSIHAPVWGAKDMQMPQKPAKCFNPRTRVGCETFASTVPALQWFQSTHPCGVRRSRCNHTAKHTCFNPRTRVGCEYSTTTRPRASRFQSTHPCGVRTCLTVWVFFIACFNPRTRVGCEQICACSPTIE